MHPATLAQRLVDINQLRERKIKEGAWSSDDYERGFADGLIVAVAMLSDEQPVLLETKKAAPASVSAGQTKKALDELGDKTAPEIRNAVLFMNDTTFLTAFLSHERVGKNRKSVIDAIQARLGEMRNKEVG